MLGGYGSDINIPGSGSCKKFRIRPDPDPQNCLELSNCSHAILPVHFNNYSHCLDTIRNFCIYSRYRYDIKYVSYYTVSRYVYLTQSGNK